MLGVQTLRPNAAPFVDPGLVVTGAGAAAALADDDDATTVFGNNAAALVLAFPAPAVAAGAERVGLVRVRLRARDLDNQGTVIRADLAAGAATIIAAAESAPTILDPVTYVGRWFAYRPAGGRWSTADATAIQVSLNFLSGATAVGADAVAVYLDVDVRPHLYDTRGRRQ